MKIVDVSHSQVDSHRFLLVRITTDEGIVGYGEGSGLTGAREWVGRFADHLVGEDPFDVQRIVTQLLWGKQQGAFLTYGEGMERPVDDWLTRYGAAGASLSHSATRAVSAIEMALLDVVGKALETPVYNLLGGKFRTSIPVYLDCAGIESTEPSAWTEEGHRVRELGFRAVKFDVDMLAAPPTRDPWNRALSIGEIRSITEIIGSIREGLGPNVELAVDCHGQYNVVDAVKLAKALEPFDLLWMEDPLPDYNPGALADVRQQTSTPIASGELFQTLFEHREYIDAHAVDILHPDTRMVGGILEHKRVADYADAHYIPCASHNGASPLGTAAMAHGAAAIRSFLFLEYHWFGIKWIDELMKSGPRIVNGSIELSDAPGFGAEPEEASWQSVNTSA